MGFCTKLSQFALGMNLFSAWVRTSVIAWSSGCGAVCSNRDVLERTVQLTRFGVLYLAILFPDLVLFGLLGGEAGRNTVPTQAFRATLLVQQLYLAQRVWSEGEG